MDLSDLPDLDKLRLHQSPVLHDRRKLPRHQPGQKFLKGPIPLPWLTAAANLPGKALGVGLAIWYLAGMRRSHIVRMMRSALTAFNVGRKAGYSGLAALEEAGLIRVNRHTGRLPLVELLDIGLSGVEPAARE
jgi:hypothetical protein